MRRFARDERGIVTLETTLMVLVLVPLLFALIEFGALYQRWLAQDAVAVQAARLAAEVGGDTPAVRDYVTTQLRLVGIDPARVTVRVDPARVGWRAPVRVSLHSEERIALPFLFSAVVPLHSTGIGRGEVNR